MSGKLFNRNLFVRTLSGAVLLIAVAGSVLFSQWTFGLLLLVIGVGCLREFYGIALMSGTKPQKEYGTALGVAMIATSFLVTNGRLSPVCLTLFFPLMAVVFIIELYRKKDNPLVNIAATLAGVIYIAVPISLICFMALQKADGQALYQPWVVLSYIFIVWANDIGAYLFGVAFGRNRLFERISPKKSWEGFFGGLLTAIGTGALAGHLLGFNLFVWGGLGLVAALSGVFGDLVESLLKRSVNIKDSGSIMPGHGGFLDRFDALILSIPFAIVYFIFF